MKPDGAHDLVKKAYADVARKQSSCCGPSESCCSDTAYTVPDHPVPESELGLSCGNPVAFSHLAAGDVVLDLGSGAGKDVFLAAQKVGGRPRHRRGHDARDAGPGAEERRQVLRRDGPLERRVPRGHIEALPVEDASVDVVISNCVINLSPDKPRSSARSSASFGPAARWSSATSSSTGRCPSASLATRTSTRTASAGRSARGVPGGDRAAGFAEVEILSNRSYSTKQIGGDPITAEIGALLDGLAASITVLGPEEGLIHKIPLPLWERVAEGRVRGSANSNDTWPPFTPAIPTEGIRHAVFGLRQCVAETHIYAGACPPTFRTS